MPALTPPVSGHRYCRESVSLNESDTHASRIQKANVAVPPAVFERLMP